MVFFSTNRRFAALLLVLTFMDPLSGMAGLFSILVATGLSFGLGLDQHPIKQGAYGFNALLVGLGLGAYYETSLPLYGLLIVAAMITLFITILLQGILTKYKLPYISLPFVLALWAVMLASRTFEALGVSQRGLYLLNELYAVGDHALVDTYTWLQGLPVPLAFKTYLRSLGAILFQFNAVSGLVLAFGLFFYSRIAFVLSLLGFFSAWVFYQLIGADLDQLNYNYIGFNYILSAIAIGGFFLVPSRASFLWALGLIPVLAIATTSATALLAPFGLGAYSLPFNLVVISFLYVLKWRNGEAAPVEVAFQTYSPEKNLYHYLADLKRFRYYKPFPVRLPLMGRWFVSQGYDGRITHRASWKHAWDFEILDGKGKKHRADGSRLEDYYCYDQPVLAPAQGRVVDIRDGVPDNVPGDSNLRENWGNTVVLEHAPYFYSQLSHLKPGSLRVGLGDYVKRGDRLALCGNSGRSPEPHLHLQWQAAPAIGSPTIPYPIGMYRSFGEGGERDLHLAGIPQEGTSVEPVALSKNLKQAFHFIPGRQLVWQQAGEEVIWQCNTTTTNVSYLEDARSGARAYFLNNGQVHYFTSYEGRGYSLLYHFFLAHYQVPFLFTSGERIQEDLPLDLVVPPRGRWWLDAFSPFFRPFSVVHRMQSKGDPSEVADELTLETDLVLWRFGKDRVVHAYQSTIKSGALQAFTLRRPDGGTWILDQNLRKHAKQASSMV